MSCSLNEEAPAQPLLAQRADDLDARYGLALPDNGRYSAASSTGYRGLLLPGRLGLSARPDGTLLVSVED